MRALPALLHAMRTRRTRRIDLDEADRLAAGDPTGPEHPGLGTLLDTLRAPGTPGELATEKTTVAAFTAHRKRAARAARRNHRTRTPTRAIVISLTTALALLTLGTAALAARTGNLPVGAQQHAHRLFSALGVPAPRTGRHHTPKPAAATTPSPAPTVEQLGWCADWQPGGTGLSSENHRKLRAAAGSEQGIPAYCDTLRRSATTPSTPPGQPSEPPSAPTSGPPGTGPVPSGGTDSGPPSANPVTPTDPAPTMPTPPHPGRNAPDMRR